MPKRRLGIHNVNGDRPPVLIVDVGILDRLNAVYFHIVKRPLQYPSGQNRIVYIGTTKKGVERIMSSMAERAEEAFDLWGGEGRGGTRNRMQAGAESENMEET